MDQEVDDLSQGHDVHVLILIFSKFHPLSNDIGRQARGKMVYGINSIRRGINGR
jgi:hypothetical protein